MSIPGAILTIPAGDGDRTLRVEALADGDIELAVRIPWTEDDGRVGVTPAEAWISKADARRLAAFLLRWADEGQ